MGFNDTVRKVVVSLSCKHNNDTIAYSYNDELKELTLERIAEGKFFGITVAQKLNVKLINSNNDIPLQAGDEILPWFYSGSDNKSPNKFYITEIHKDENTNELSITAYDTIYFLTNYSFGELGTVSSIDDILTAIANLVPEITYVLRIGVEDSTAFDYIYSGDNKINIEPTENLRNVLTQICEATLTIAYMVGNNLYLQRLLPDDTEEATIDKSKYFKLSSNSNRRLVGIVSTTELGDNVGEEDVVSGTVAYVNENGFWNYTNDVSALVHKAYTLMNGLTIGLFEMEWRGNPTINYGAKIKIEDKQGNYIYSYLLDDVITYNGSYKQKTKWIYNDLQTTQYNSASIGDALSKASARVDKVNGRIDLVVEDYNDLIEEAKAQITVQTNAIVESVESISSDADSILAALDNYITTNDEAITGLDTLIAQVRQSTEQLQTDSAYYFNVINTLQESSGLASYVSTTTATIDNEGITVSKSGSSIETTISEDGMLVKDGSTIELTANSQGVIAHNLTADNYLIIDGLIRFLKYGINRVGCYWIGG